ncbi:MAG: IclR family transcriptional regulator [Candidatus Acidiferrales bacterium]
MRRKEHSVSGTSKSLRKAIRILFHIGQNGPELGITQLASALSLNKTTVYRLLHAMESFHLIEKNAQTERYRLGLKLYDLGTKAVESRTLQSESRRFLVEMSHQASEAVSLAVPGVGGIVCLDRVDSARSVITVRTPIGSHFPAHCTAVGKAVLAYLSDEEIGAIFAGHGLARFTPSTLTRFPDLKSHLAQIRRRGYSIDQQELERGLSGVAAPVLSEGGRVIAAVGIAGPTLRFRGKELAQKVALVKDTAAKISARFRSASLGIEPADTAHNVRGFDESRRDLRPVTGKS